MNIAGNQRNIIVYSYKKVIYKELAHVSIKFGAKMWRRKFTVGFTQFRWNSSRIWWYLIQTGNPHIVYQFDSIQINKLLINLSRLGVDANSMGNICLKYVVSYVYIRLHTDIKRLTDLLQRFTYKLRYEHNKWVPLLQL